MSYQALITALKGSSLSGNFGHSGRQGKIGGSIAYGADKGGGGIGGSGMSTQISGNVSDGAAVRFPDIA